MIVLSLRTQGLLLGRGTRQIRMPWASSVHVDMPSVLLFVQRVLFISFLWLGMACSLYAQQPATTGNHWQGVLDDSAFRPLAGATIELSAPGHTATAVTGRDGSFSFRDLPPLRFEIWITVAGSRIDGQRTLDMSRPQE